MNFFFFFCCFPSSEKDVPFLPNLRLFFFFFFPIFPKLNFQIIWKINFLLTKSFFFLERKKKKEKETTIIWKEAEYWERKKRRENFLMLRRLGSEIFKKAFFNKWHIMWCSCKGFYDLTCGPLLPFTPFPPLTSAPFYSSSKKRL